jgi:hypothetical protein
MGRKADAQMWLTRAFALPIVTLEVLFSPAYSLSLSLALPLSPPSLTPTLSLSRPLPLPPLSPALSPPSRPFLSFQFQPALVASLSLPPLSLSL